MTSMRSAWALFWASFFVAGCGTQGDASVLPDTWPRAGLSGYVFFDPDAPDLLSQPGFDLDEPAAAPEADGALSVFGRMATSKAPLASQIFSARVAMLDAPDVPQLALEPTLPWEGQGLRGPSVADAELPLLFYQGEDGSVGVAERDGSTLKKSNLAAPLASAALLGGARRVGRVACIRDRRDGVDQFRLYYTVDDFEVYVAVAAAAPLLSGASVDWQVRPLGLTVASFLVPPGDSKAVPAERISQLSVRRVVTPIGRVRWDLFLVASGSRRDSLVAASAYAEGDSGFAERFVAASTALISTSDGVLLSPTVTTFLRKPLLLLGLRQVQTTIAAAVLP